MLRKIFLLLTIFVFSNAIASDLDFGSDGKLVGVTSLMSAAANNDVQGVKFFTRTDASSINKRNFGGATALHMAARQGNFEIADILIKSGAKADIADNEGWTPLMRAALIGNRELIKLFMDNGANAMQRNSVGESAMVISVGSRCSECLKEMFASPFFLRNVDDRILKQQLSDAYAIAQNHEDKASENILSAYLNTLTKANFAAIAESKTAAAIEVETPQNKQPETILTPIVATSSPVLFEETHTPAPVIFPHVDKKFKFKKSKKEVEPTVDVIAPAAVVAAPIVVKKAPEVSSPKEVKKFKFSEGEAAKKIVKPEVVAPAKIVVPVKEEVAPVVTPTPAPVVVPVQAPTAAAAPAVIATIPAAQVVPVAKIEEKPVAKNFVYKKAQDNSAAKPVAKEEISLAKPSKKIAKITKPLPVVENEKKKVFSFKEGKEKAPTIVNGIPTTDLPSVKRAAPVATPEVVEEEVMDLQSDEPVKTEEKSGKKFVFKSSSK